MLDAESYLLILRVLFLFSSLSLNYRCSRARNAKPRARIPQPAIRSPERKVQRIDALTRSRAPGQPRSPRSRRGQVAHRHHHITDPPVTPARFTKPQSSKSKSKTSAACGSSTCDFVEAAAECPESPFFFLVFVFVFASTLCASMSCMRAERQDDIASYLFSVDSCTSLPLTSDLVPGKAKSHSERCPPDVCCAAASGHIVQCAEEEERSPESTRPTASVPSPTTVRERERENTRIREPPEREHGRTPQSGRTPETGEKRKAVRSRSRNGARATCARLLTRRRRPSEFKSVRRPRRDVASAGISRVACILHKRLSRHRCFVLVCGVR